ncbi:MAG: transposase [Ruthenibacterium sp.]
MTNLPQRKKMRLQTYDYSQNGAYFITICTKDKANLFGDILDGVMHFSSVGKIASQNIAEIENHIVGVTVAHYVVMPNHVHIILMVDVASVGPRYIVAEPRAPKNGCQTKKNKSCRKQYSN